MRNPKKPWCMKINTARLSTYYNRIKGENNKIFKLFSITLKIKIEICTYKNEQKNAY